MSNSAVLDSALVATRDSTEEVCANPGVRPHRGDRSVGKGRRRRAVAEQRRTELEHWDRRTHDSEEEIYVAPRPISRRQSRRAARHLARDELDCPFFDGFGEENDLDVALGAISLSLSDSDNNVIVANQRINLASSTDGLLDMSYENLVLLENVKCTASPALVNTLTGYFFDKSNHTSSENLDELCAICQNEYEVGDTLMMLPCMHNLHVACGSEWLLNHSKLCPVCKHDVTEKD